MAIIVRLIGKEDGSDEYAAAAKLKQIIETTTPQTALGEIVLFPSATLYGQAVKDVDIMMIGSIKNCCVKVELTLNGENHEEEVFLESFCTTVEVKSHSFSAVRIEGTNFQVLYSNSGWHNATKQSNEQKTSAINFFRSTLGDSPFVTNLLWFVGISNAELNSLLTNGNRIMPSNALPSSFEFKAIVQKLATQSTPKKYGNRYYIDGGFNGRDVDHISKPLNLFSRVKQGVGELTRKRIEQITNSELGNISEQIKENELNIFRGRAGTGKTINLIKIAVGLVDIKGARVQILTYNRALVSDIRRLFALAELPDMFQEKCVAVNTMHSFFYGIINGCLYDGKLSGEEFLSRYSELLNEMIEFLESDEESRSIIQEICADNPKLNWDYILVDEAQDWSVPERNLILKLYEKDRIIVADGGQQFVRNIEPCDWTIIPTRNSIRLKNCLRQKKNIVGFINHLSEMVDGNYNRIVPSEHLVGGKVIIIKDKKKLYQTIKNEKIELKRAGNDPYDFLFITPSTLVENPEGRHHFKLTGEFEKMGILLWDGTDEDNRLEYASDIEASRVVQYESARGLEGWTVCCLDFDRFLQIKEQQCEKGSEGNALLLESPSERKRRNLLNWAMIPLTRAIDTLIISLEDETAKYSEILCEIAEKHPDYVQIV